MNEMNGLVTCNSESVHVFYQVPRLHFDHYGCYIITFRVKCILVTHVCVSVCPALLHGLGCNLGE